MNDCWWISLLNKYAVKILLCRYSWKAPCPCTVDNFSKSWVQDSRGHHRHMQHNQRLREFHWYRSLGWGTCSSLAKPLDDVEIDFFKIFFFVFLPPTSSAHQRIWSQPQLSLISFAYLGWLWSFSSLAWLCSATTEYNRNIFLSMIWCVSTYHQQGETNQKNSWHLGVLHLNILWVQTMLEIFKYFSISFIIS